MWFVYRNRCAEECSSVCSSDSMGRQLWMVFFSCGYSDVRNYMFESVQTQLAREGGLNRHASVPTAPTVSRFIGSSMNKNGGIMISCGEQ